jgi:hypothetical protein
MLSVRLLWNRRGWGLLFGTTALHHPLHPGLTLSDGFTQCFMVIPFGCHFLRFAFRSRLLFSSILYNILKLLIFYTKKCNLKRKNLGFLG